MCDTCICGLAVSMLSGSLGPAASHGAVAFAPSLTWPGQDHLDLPRVRGWLRGRRRRRGAGAEVVVAGSGVGEQVPDDDQDGAGDGDQRLELAAALDDPAVAFAEEGVGLGGRGGDLTEDAFEVGVALAGFAGPVFCPGLDGPRA